MSRSRVIAAVAFVAGTVATGSSFQAGRPWPPSSQEEHARREREALGGH